MVTFQINSTDMGAIEQLLHIAREQFNLPVKVLDGLKKPQQKETKWMVFLLLKLLNTLKRVVKKQERVLSLDLKNKVVLWVELIF